MTVREAAQRLAEVLERENDALRAMDLRRAVALLADKTAAVADLTAVGDRVPAPRDPAMISLAQRLDRLAQENRQLLERAIAAQRRVVAIIVRAAASVAVAPAYAPDGRQARMREPMALSTHA